MIDSLPHSPFELSAAKLFGA